MSLWPLDHSGRRLCTLHFTLYHHAKSFSSAHGHPYVQTVMWLTCCWSKLQSFILFTYFVCWDFSTVLHAHRYRAFRHCIVYQRAISRDFWFRYLAASNTLITVLPVQLVSREFCSCWTVAWMLFNSAALYIQYLKLSTVQLSLFSRLFSFFS